jgi:hypothetical protein
LPIPTVHVGPGARQPIASRLSVAYEMPLVQYPDISDTRCIIRMNACYP